jgi:hypothetical protein
MRIMLLGNRIFDKVIRITLILGATFLAGCSADQPQQSTKPGIETSTRKKLNQGAEAMTADVLSVNVTGSPSAYQFSVEIASPDTGCDQYADWWEVVTEDGQLLHRRILLHSHVNEQPFTRSGGPVEINADTVVIVRAHMNNSGYGGMAMKGTVDSGFTEVDLAPDFAASLASEPPQPEGCDF